MKHKILALFGTRPEGIKMAPLIKELQKNSNSFEVVIAVTAQHREMLDQVLEFFGIIPHYDLNLMKPGQTISGITSGVLEKVGPIIAKENPDLIFVQGDTTTVMAGALTSFYLQKPVAHLEAGLRTRNKYSPYPEEMNRRMTSQIADWHFAPTERAVANLRAEGITQNVYHVGNTVIDALFLGLKLIEEKGESIYEEFFKKIDITKRIILVTGHRRENFGEPFENMCSAMKEIALEYPDVDLIYPVHLNPNVRKPVFGRLKDIHNIKLIEPLDYPHLIWLMNKSYLVLTDSGGIQEEAPSLGKPVLVMRNETERLEGIEAGTAKLVGTEKEVILKETRILLDNKDEYSKMANAVNPYGDGTSSRKIVEILKNEM